MYSPTLGRWIQNDPIGFMAGDTDLYRFVGNNPVTFVDPSGLVAVPGGSVDASVDGDDFRVTFTGPRAGERGYFKVKQWVQTEVYARYEFKDRDAKGPCLELTDWERLRPGQNLDTPLKPGEKQHDHTHTSSTPFRPSLQPDHGGGDGFSVGPYTPGKNNTVTYHDNPGAPNKLQGPASSQFPDTTTNKGRQCKLKDVRVVQRFITQVYVGNTPVQTYHWTSTAEGPPGNAGIPTVNLIGSFPGAADPTQTIMDWAAGQSID